MALVASLLEFPTTSNGLQNLGSSFVDLANDGSGSPRRKVARLETDYDIASRSTSKGKQAEVSSGTFVIKIIGEDISRPVKNDVRQAQIALIRRCLKILLAIPQNPNQDQPPREVLPATYEKIYSTCRTIVTVNDDGADLYGNVKLELELAMTKLSSHLLGYDANEKIKWLSLFAGYCRWFEAKIALLQSLLTYLDRVYVTSHILTMTPIRDLAYGLFAERIFGNPQIGERLRSGISKWLEHERDHETEEERPEIADLIKYLIAHKQYPPFEEHYIEITQFYYQKEAKANGQAMKDNPKALFNRIESRINQELARSRDLLPVGSWNIILETTEQNLLEKMAEYLADSLVPIYFSERNIDKLAALYARFARVDSVQFLSQAFKDLIQSEVKTIVTDNSRDDEMVQRLLQLKELGDEVIAKAFAKSPTSATASTSTVPLTPDQTFIYALSDAFNLGFRTRRNKPAEMIAKHLDKQLRKGQKDKNEAVFQKELITVLPLYRYTEDKDVFRTFYHRMLAKRLLLGKSASNTIEQWMLEELKNHYDPEFGNAKDMLKDLTLSSELMEKFHEQNAARGDDDEETAKLNVMVLQHSVWPFSRPKQEVDLPANMQAQVTKFKNYYIKIHSGRALHWDHALGTMTIKATFKAGVKELSVSLYQGLTLLLFNDQDEVSFKEAVAQTRMEDGELRRTLQSLACGKKKVLKKIPAGRDVNDGDVFKYNPDFTDEFYRVHINTIQAKVSAEESQRTTATIEGERVHLLDAAIVRIMKAKKEMLYEPLKLATIEAVKNHFVPSVESIKKCIDSLVEREYLERSSEDKNKFLYLA